MIRSTTTSAIRVGLAPQRTGGFFGAEGGQLQPARYNKSPEGLLLQAEISATQTQTTDQSGVTGQVFALQVVQQLTTLVNHADQTTT